MRNTGKGSIRRAAARTPDEDAASEAPDDYDPREFQEMCEMFEMTPPGTPRHGEPAAAAAPAADGDDDGRPRGSRGPAAAAAESGPAAATAPTAATAPDAARRARAFADFEDAARARYLEDFARLTTSDGVVSYAWPQPELGPDGLPLPLPSRGVATAPAPAPERPAPERPATADRERAAAPQGSQERRRSHAETRRRALAAKPRRIFCAGRSRHRGPLMPPMDRLAPLPARPRDPFAPLGRDERETGSRYEISLAASVSHHQGGQSAEREHARSVALDADVEMFFDRAVVEAARARPMLGAPRGRQRYSSPYSRRVGRRFRPLEGGGTASVARAIASTAASTAASAGVRSVASALTVDDFSVASAPLIPYPPSLARLDRRESMRLNAAVAAVRGGTAPVEERAARMPQGGTVMASFRVDDANALGRIHAESLFGELCAAARASPGHLPIEALLDMSDWEASELKDHPILQAIRLYPIIRKVAACYAPEDPRGVDFLEFDQLQAYFTELIRTYGLDLPPADAVAAPVAAEAAGPVPAPVVAEAPAEPELLWPDSPIVARSIDPKFRAGYPPKEPESLPD